MHSSAGRSDPARPRFDVADILRAHFEGATAHSGLTPEQRKAVRDITRCRTAALGGHMQRCMSCGDERPAYNSCRNRHCPKCQALAQARWVDGQLQRILPVRCFHLVFTLPAALRPMARHHPSRIYDLLFETVSTTLLSFGQNPKWLGARLGITAVLHTWARDLAFHPHLHCIVTAGGLTEDGNRFVHTGQRFLFPVRALSAVFRARFVEGLERLREQTPLAPWLDLCAFRALVRDLCRTDWNVYAKAPFAGPMQVFKYLGHYTHRVGLSNHRLLEVSVDRVAFRTRGERKVSMSPAEFTKRFLTHILPHRYVKIRHYGLMANGQMAARRQKARQLLSQDRECLDRPQARGLTKLSWDRVLCAVAGVEVQRCPRCGELAVARGPLPAGPELATARPRPPPRLSTA